MHQHFALTIMYTDKHLDRTTKRILEFKGTLKLYVMCTLMTHLFPRDR